MPSNRIEYDPNIIQEFAQRLYKKAATIIVAYTIAGILVGAIICALLFGLVRWSEITPSTGAIFGAVFGGIFGYARGSENAFKLKLDAQLALCQVQIEFNTQKPNLQDPVEAPKPVVASTMQSGYSPCPSCGASVNDQSVKCWSCSTRIREI